MRSPGTPASASPPSPRASMWKVSTASVTAGCAARVTASQAWPTRLTWRPQASASNATVTPCSAASTPTRWSCSAVRSASSGASASVAPTVEQASAVVAPSSPMTANLVRSRWSTLGKRSGGTPATSRSGW